MKVLIIGATGFIGRYLLRRLADSPGVAVSGTYRANAPGVEGVEWHRAELTNAQSIEAAFSSVRPDVVVHLAAMADVGACEREPERATAVNVVGTSTVARLCERWGAHLVFVSTEYVFDGQRGFYREDEAPVPVTHYGRTKQEAEQVVAELASRWSVVRTSIVYGWPTPGRRNFVPSLVERLKSGQPYAGHWKVLRTPVYVGHLVDGIAALVEQQSPGVFHIAGRDWVSMYEFAIAVAEAFGLDSGLVTPADCASHPVSGERLGLDCNATMRALGITQPGLAEGLAAMRARGSSL